MSWFFLVVANNKISCIYTAWHCPIALYPGRQMVTASLFQILSGDAVVIRGVPKGGPPPERTISLSNITAPRLARRPNPSAEGSVETKDEVWYLGACWTAGEVVVKINVIDQIKTLYYRFLQKLYNIWATTLITNELNCTKLLNVIY